jgi:hypothetical protein
MDKNKIARIDEIEGMTIDVKDTNRNQLVILIENAIQLASAFYIEEEEFTPELKLIKSNKLNLASSSALQTVSALLAVASAKCHLSTPPEDIDMKLNSSGRLIYRCYHTPPHEWDLIGNPIP